MYIFESTKNTRPVLSDGIKYIRSDVPTAVSDEEVEWLINNGVTTVIDLRTDAERAKKPCPLATNPHFSYHNYTLAGGDRIPKTPDEVSGSYIGMLDSVFEQVMELLLTSTTNVLYFCNAGKDRTGVVSAVLLCRLGYSREYIVSDYMKSSENLRAAIAAFVEQNPEIDVNVITPHERYIEEFLNLYTGKLK